MNFDYVCHKDHAILARILQLIIQPLLHQGFTINEYFLAMQFASISRIWRRCFPDFACQYLILHRQVDGPCEARGVRSVHKGRWLSNYRFLSSMGKEHLITEFRVAMLDECRHSLTLSQAIRHIDIDRCQMSTVQKLVFIGSGVFTSNMYLYRRDRQKIDKDTASLLLDMFPNITSMRYSLADSRFQSIGHPAHPNPETSRFYEMLLERRLSSLHMAQAFNPLPVKTCIRFSQHLTHLQLNADLVATNNEVALIPVDQLRRLEMVHIDGVAPWHKFVRSGNTVKFTNLECLIMRFHNTAHLRLQFPGYDLILQLPSLKFLTVFNSGYAYRDLYTFFAQYQLTSVNISERFEHFGMIGPKIMQSTKVMRLMNLETSSRITIKCSSEVFQELFAYTAGIEKLSLAGLYYPMPMCILLTWLVSLEISVCIADYGSIVNLISNLPYLSELCICCMSMDRRDAQYTIFKDLDMAFKMNDLLYNPQDRFAISHALRRLEISTVRSLKMIPIVALACRLPKLCQLGVDKGYINGLCDLFRATKELSNGILIHEFKPLS